MSLTNQRNQKDEKTNDVFYDETLNYVYKKSERILSAIYMVTGLIKDEEPLKNAIRQSSINLLKDTIRTDAERVSEKDTTARRIVVHLTELGSLLAVAESARLMSAMNHAVIRREIVGLINLLADRYERGREHLTIDPTFFSVAAVPFSTQPVQTVTGSNMQGSPSAPRAVPFTKRHDLATGVLQKTSTTVRMPDTDGTAPDELKVARPAQQRVFNRNDTDRTDAIIALLKDKGRITIKDVSVVLKDVSEKTVQRELLSLVASGRVRKEGERRWSTYSLI